MHSLKDFLIFQQNASIHQQKMGEKVAQVSPFFPFHFHFLFALDFIPRHVGIFLIGLRNVVFFSPLTLLRATKKWTCYSTDYFGYFFYSRIFAIFRMRLIQMIDNLFFPFYTPFVLLVFFSRHFTIAVGLCICFFFYTLAVDRDLSILKLQSCRAVSIMF